MKNWIAPNQLRHAKRYVILAAFCAAALLVGVHEIFGHNGYVARRRHRIQIENLTSDIQKLKQENSDLTRKIQALRSDPDTIETLAREQLRLGRPGDIVITLNPSQPSPPAASSSK